MTKAAVDRALFWFTLAGFFATGIYVAGNVNLLHRVSPASILFFVACAVGVLFWGMIFLTSPPIQEKEDKRSRKLREQYLQDLEEMELDSGEQNPDY